MNAGMLISSGLRVVGGFVLLYIAERVSRRCRDGACHARLT